MGLYEHHGNEFDTEYYQKDDNEFDETEYYQEDDYCFDSYTFFGLQDLEDILFPCLGSGDSDSFGSEKSKRCIRFSYIC